MFNSLFSRTVWVSQHHRKVKPIWILMKQWHQPDHMKLICISLQTSTIQFNLLQYRPDALPDAQLTVSKH